MTKNTLRSLLKVFLGNAVLGFAYAKLLVPHTIINGGVTSLSLVLSYFIPLRITFFHELLDRRVVTDWPGFSWSIVFLYFFGEFPGLYRVLQLVLQPSLFDSNLVSHRLCDRSGSDSLRVLLLFV
nr:YitT family protein [Lacticaseibacillus nasuensis]